MLLNHFHLVITYLDFGSSCEINMVFLSYLLLCFLTLVTAKPTVYLIRHGENPTSGHGLDFHGVERSECLVDLFNATSHYEIGHIMAQKPKRSGKQQHSYDTVLPLAESLNMTVDTSCRRDDSACVADVVANYTGHGNILICWEHKHLTNILVALGELNAPTYPNAS